MSAKQKGVFSPELQRNIDKVKAMGEALLKKINKKYPKLVWVTFDPLLERVICVHDVPDCVCDDCKPIWDERLEEGSIYQLEERRFSVKEYESDELEEI